jgi:hypothetical protein
VPNTVTHSTLIREARKEIRALPNPGIRPDAWRSITDLLAAIAGYLPDCWPSERALAKKLSKHHQNVHRLIVRARDLGLISTTPRVLEKSLRDGQEYHLLCLSEGLKAALSRHHFQASSDDRSKNSYSVGVQDGTTFGGPSLPGCRPADQTPPEPRSNVVPFNRPRDEDWDSPAFGEDPKGALPASEVRVDPAVYLARQFDRKWADAKRETPALRVIRASSRGMAIGYLRKVMLPEVSSAHVEAYMDAFVDACVSGDVIVKESQFAFERFTAWWGREDVEDPTERMANKAKAQWVLDQVRLQRERNA